MDLRKKHVVLTGASSGIGYELLRMLLEQGCTVVAASRSIENISLTHEQLYLKACDVSIPEQVNELFEYAISTMDHIDIFIANAGFTYYEPLGKPDWNHSRAIFDTNIISIIYCAEKMKEYYPYRPYQFVCTASGLSYVSVPGFSLYCSTKAAIRGFADAYRFEIEKNQHVQVIYPIATRTAFFAKAGDGPMPWPSQSVDVVARNIIKGIFKKQKNIYPSKLFQFGLVMNGIFPFIFVLYQRREVEKYKKWLASRT